MLAHRVGGRPLLVDAEHALLVRVDPEAVRDVADLGQRRLDERFDQSDGRVVARAAVFVRPGIHPHPDGLLAGLGCRYDEAGFVMTDGTGRTSNVGVWAAGNVADPRAQVITAAGAGSAAAIAINNDLVLADTDRAVRADHGLGTTSA